MDKAVIVRMGLLASVAAPLATAPWAAMPDPTRPPPGTVSQGTGAPAEPLLAVSTVFLMDKRPHAVVDGITVRVGDPLGDGRVSAIDERGVWLRTPSGERLLKLVPGIDKKAARQHRNRMEKQP